MRFVLSVALAGLVACVGCGCRREPEAGAPQTQPEARVAEPPAAVPKPDLPQAPPKLSLIHI